MMRNILSFILVVFSILVYCQSNIETHIIDKIILLSNEEKVNQANGIIQKINQHLKNNQSITPSKKAECYETLNIIYYYKGNYTQSTNTILKAIKIYENQKNYSKLADVYGNYGYQIKRRDMHKAEFYMNKALKIINEKKLKNKVAIIDNYGVLKEMQNQLDSASFFYNIALSYKKTINDSIGLPYSLNKVGKIHQLKKQFNLAESFFIEGLNIRLKLKDTLSIAESYGFLGHLYFDEKKYEKAKLNLIKSSDLADSKKYFDLVQKNYLLLSQIFENQDLYTEALFYYKAHTQIKEKIFNIESESKILTLEVEYETEKKEKEILTQRAKLAEKNVIIILFVCFVLFLFTIGFFYLKQAKMKAQNLEQIRLLKEVNDKIEFQNQLNEQKVRISRDLHDNIGAKLSFISSSIQNLKYIFPNISEEEKVRIDHISQFSKQTITELRDTIWAMNNDNLTLESIKTRLANFISEANQLSILLEINLYANDDLPFSHLFNAEAGINLYRIIQEAINNAFKHANCSKINVFIKKIKQDLIIEIIDNGQGFDLEKVDQGNGLINIRKRIKILNGIVKFESTTKGTVVTISIPLN